MSISELGTGGLRAAKKASRVPMAARPLHRLKTVRREQGVSMRRVAQQLRTEVRQLRAEEEETSDLRLSRLYLWQKVLEVPVADLLVDSNAPLSAPVFERARMVRVMKTVAAILEKADTPSIHRLAQTLADQLVEIMPELNGVSPWHSVGQRRSLEEYGRIVEHCYSEEVWRER